MPKKSPKKPLSVDDFMGAIPVPEQECCVDRSHPKDSPEHEAMVAFLHMDLDQRKGLSFGQFFKQYLQRHYNVRHDVSTWYSHIDKCLGLRDRIKV